MEMHIISATSELSGEEQLDLTALKLLCGKNAGISQIRGPYFNSPVSDPAKALPRFEATTERGHMSIANHAKIEVVFEGATRFLAMLLNNLRYYDTTEKSGRYTEMVGNTPEQCGLYDKWNAKFKARILELYPDYNDKFLETQIAKAGYPDVVVVCGKVEYIPGEFAGSTQSILDCCEKAKQMKSLPVNTRSQENARYVLSIFTKSTTFGYTTSLDQWNYICDWCVDYTQQFKYDSTGRLLRFKKPFGYCEATWFETKVCEDLVELEEFLLKNLYVPTLRDHKKRQFNLFSNLFSTQISTPQQHYKAAEDDHLGYAYSVTYDGSFILLSHLHRHRTLKYFAHLPNENRLTFFVPAFIRGTAMESEWIIDLQFVADYWPQGTLIRIVEAGTLDDFALKCTERLCGCAMWETMNATVDVARRFADAYDDGKLSQCASRLVTRFYDSIAGCLKTKAMMTDGCREECYFTCSRAIDRLV